MVTLGYIFGKRMGGIWALVCLSALFCHRGAAQAQTEVRLVLDKTSAKPGGQVRVAFELKIPQGWHVYWRNPSAWGGVGFAPKAEWTLPPGVTAGPIEWPLPIRLKDPAGDAPAYLGTVWLLARLNVGTNVAPGNLKIQAKLSWQECERECVRGQTNLSTTLRVGLTDIPAFESGLFAVANAKLPTTGGDVKAAAHWDGPASADSRLLVIEWETNATGGEFLPFENKDLPLDGKSEPTSVASGKLTIRHLVDRGEKGWPTSAAGLLVADNADIQRRGAEVNLPITDSIGAASASGVSASGPASIAELLPMLGLAFLGGLVLNIMPCVLPVLALKILGFVRQAGSKPRQVRRLGLVYGAGVLSSFLVLGLVGMTVQAAGSLAGWSTAFQNPQFRIVLCVLLVLVALNLFGVFEVNLSGEALDETARFTKKAVTGPLSWFRGDTGHFTQDSDASFQEGPMGAFFNGVLAAVLATPCTAPMLGTAIGFAFTQPPWILLLIFLTVGLGLATPFVVLCWRPQWLKWLPKPGDWMVRFKVAMGFPILATCVWIFWFTATRLGSAGVLWLGLFLVAISAAAWVWGEFRQRGRGGPVWLWVSGLIVAGAYLGLLEGQLDWRHPVGSKVAKLNWQPWSPAAVAAARRDGHPVLVDFTADNCLNCQVNKRTSIEIESTIQRLKKFGVTVFEADYTDADPVIAEELKRHGRRGVPLVLVYSKDAAQSPRELPSILTPSIVHEALEWASK